LKFKVANINIVIWLDNGISQKLFHSCELIEKNKRRKKKEKSEFELFCWRASLGNCLMIFGSDEKSF
jgi:hypothetical protein